jgi:hypothetical protein
MLRSVGTDIKVQQELLRHSTIQSTMNIYTQAVSEQKRAANSKVVAMILSDPLASDRTPKEAPQPVVNVNGSQRELFVTDLQLS